MGKEKQQSVKKKDQKRYIILLILLLLLFLVIYFFFIRETDNENIDISDTNSEEVEKTEDNLTPEDVLEQLEEATYVGEQVQMFIISPEGENFQMSQARNWKAQLDGIETDKNLGVNCHWQFYLNEYDEEVLYEEMENRSGVSKEDPTLCSFTSTFINSRGKLRVKLTAEIQNSSGDILETLTAERKYTVL